MKKIILAGMLISVVGSSAKEWYTEKTGRYLKPLLRPVGLYLGGSLCCYVPLYLLNKLHR